MNIQSLTPYRNYSPINRAAQINRSDNVSFGKKKPVEDTTPIEYKSREEIEKSFAEYRDGVLKFGMKHRIPIPLQSITLQKIVDNEKAALAEWDREHSPKK